MRDGMALTLYDVSKLFRSCSPGLSRYNSVEKRTAGQIIRAHRQIRTVVKSSRYFCNSCFNNSGSFWDFNYKSTIKASHKKAFPFSSYCPSLRNSYKSKAVAGASKGSRAVSKQSSSMKDSQGEEGPRGLKLVDNALREKFIEKIPVVAARVHKSKVQSLVKQLSDSKVYKSTPDESNGLDKRTVCPLLRISRVRGVEHDILPDGSTDKNSNYRLVLLAQHITLGSVKRTDDIDKIDIDDLSGLSQRDNEILRGVSVGFLNYTITLGYRDCSTDQVLKRLLPSSVKEIPSSFETVGHIAHMNLRDEFLEHKQIICEVILDKNFPNIKTVVNKVGQIENKFRCLPLEIVCGIKKTETRVRQHGAVFAMDYAKVYWNSRLEREHQRLVHLFQSKNQEDDDVIADVMAGVGPFAIPSALKGCTVYANDLNPSSYEYLRYNSRTNKVPHKVSCSCVDGRDFIRHVLTSTLSSGTKGRGNNQFGSINPQLPQLTRPVTRIVMNLPATALEFLDCIADAMKCYNNKDEILSKMGSGNRNQLPFIHVYSFVKAADQHSIEGVKKVTESHLGCIIDRKKDEYSIHIVRDVAPHKVMVCVSFRIPLSLLRSETFGESVDSKRQKTS